MLSTEYLTNFNKYVLRHPNAKVVKDLEPRVKEDWDDEIPIEKM